MKKVLLARNSVDGVVASLIFQENFRTCDPMFFEHEKAVNFSAMGIPVYSAGVPVKGAELYIDTEGEPREDKNAVIRKERSLAHIANALFPGNKYFHLADLCFDTLFWCFFELYGAGSCFGQLRFDVDSWNDENVVKYKELQENLAQMMLTLEESGYVFVAKLPRGAGEYCRRLTFNKTNANVVLFIDGDKFYAYGRSGYERAISKLRGVKIIERKENRVSGYIYSRMPVKKVKENLEKEVSKIILEDTEYCL